MLFLELLVAFVIEVVAKAGHTRRAVGVFQRRNPIVRVVGVSGHSAVAVSARDDPVAQVVTILHDGRRRAGIVDVIQSSSGIGVLRDLPATRIGDLAGASENIVTVTNGLAILLRLGDTVGAIIGESNERATALGGQHAARKIVGEVVGGADWISSVKQEIEIVIAV